MTTFYYVNAKLTPARCVLQNHVMRVPSGHATHVRAMLFANKAMATRDHLEQQVRPIAQSNAWPRIQHRFSTIELLGPISPHSRAAT